VHILQITNHGLHDWQVTPGLPDTGGQNVYVNQLSAALVGLGHEVTIVNRGGYPHPLTGVPRVGTTVGLEGRASIVYLSDSTETFVRKEDMADRLPELADQLDRLLRSKKVDLIISHYWDGALLGILANEKQVNPRPHVWIPHSLGTLKRRNVEPEAWKGLRIEERIDAEQLILQQVDGVAATSVAIRESLWNDYGVHADFFLPPGVDQERYRPRSRGDCKDIWDFLAGQLPSPTPRIDDRPLILEVSRTDNTKRKDVLIRAFAEVHRQVPEALLAVTIDDVNHQLHDELLDLIRDLDVADHVAVLGSVWDKLPCLYAVSTVYCTPSVMEGFGMSAQEATASGVPVVSSDLVPFVTEHLLGTNPREMSLDHSGTILVGEGAIVVPADSVAGFAQALLLLLTDADLRTQQGRVAHDITVPAFSWDRLAEAFLDSVIAAQQTDA
jgi:mannosylfructose-phosphate synthase